ncbi:MAG: SirB2 family protein [Rubrivivax sp.]
MNVSSWVVQIKQLHIALVAASGLLFAMRGAAVLAGQRWAMRGPWRWLSVGIDTLLLSAGVTLWAILAINPVQSPWLGTKLLLLVAYIVLGSLALKRAPTPAARRLSFAAALAVYLFMVSVALAHHPLGILHA